jgi:hypothetical protein
VSAVEGLPEVPFDPRAKRGDPFYRPGPDWPPSIGELEARRAVADLLRDLEHDEDGEA